MDYEQFKVYMKESVETVTGRKVTGYIRCCTTIPWCGTVCLLIRHWGHRQGLRLFCGITISSMRKELLRACW